MAAGNGPAQGSTNAAKQALGAANLAEPLCDQHPAVHRKAGFACRISAAQTPRRETSHRTCSFDSVSSSDPDVTFEAGKRLISESTMHMDDENGCPSPPAHKLLDADEAIRDLGGDRDGYIEIAEIFLDELPAVMGILNQRSQGPVAALLPVIHEAANSLGVIRATSSERSVRQLEGEIRRTGNVSAHDAAARTMAALQQAGNALRNWMESGR